MNEALAEAREAGGLQAASELVMVEIGTRLACVVDEAWESRDRRAFLAAVSKLMSVLDALGLGSRRGGDGGGGSPGGSDAIDRELADLVGSGPTVHHSKDS